MKHPCLECGAPCDGSYCDKHVGLVEQRRGTRSERGYDNDWLRIQRRTIKAWVRTHGWLCPGYNREQHHSKDLTVHHKVSLSAGGTHHHTNLIVYCRTCHAYAEAAQVGGEGRVRDFPTMRQNPLPVQDDRVQRIIAEPRTVFVG